MDFRGLAIIAATIAVLFACAAGVVAFSGTDAFEMIKTQVDANNALAQAERASALADLADEQTELEYAAGERILKTGQAEALTIAANASAETVKTSNRLVTLWGISFPAMPPLYLVLGAAFGIPVGYALGINKMLTQPAQVVTKEETQPSPIPEPNVIGAA